MTMNLNIEINAPIGKRLGKAPARGNIKQLFLSNYLKKAVPVPAVYNYWAKKPPFQPYDVGNNEYGCCTFASQALLIQRMERIEQKATIQIPKQHIIDTYFALTQKLYGGGDIGAYETDALDNWRDPTRTLKGKTGRAYTIDAYTRINQANIEEVKQALFLAGAHGIKVCFNLPSAWSSLGTAQGWDLPAGQQLINEWVPGSWGGHSMMAAADWDENWLWLPSSWNEPDRRISWRAFATYCDEAYLCIDSVDAWRKKPHAKNIDLAGLKNDVNKVSSIKIA